MKWKKTLAMLAGFAVVFAAASACFTAPKKDRTPPYQNATNPPSASAAGR